MCTIAYRQALINDLLATTSALAAPATGHADPITRAAASPESASIRPADSTTKTGSVLKVGNQAYANRSSVLPWSP
jgi:hypothetical protein